MKTWTFTIPFFAAHELECKCGCGSMQMDVRFAAHLPALRAAWDKPLTPTSACRCPTHNRKVGGHPRSLHLTFNPAHQTNGCMAIDLYWAKWPTQEKIDFCRLAYQMGWRVGLHKTFVHIDRGRDIGITPHVFLYGEWDNAFSPEDIM